MEKKFKNLDIHLDDLIFGISLGEGNYFSFLACFARDFTHSFYFKNSVTFLLGAFGNVRVGWLKSSKS